MRLTLGKGGGTLWRIAGCGLLFLLLFPQGQGQPLALLGLATLLCLLAVYELSIRDISPDGLLVAVAVILVGSAVGWLAWIILFPPPPEPTGPLLPANEPTPEAICGRPGDMVVAIGPNRAAIADADPRIPFAAAGCPGPVLTRDPHGLTVEAFGFDWDNDIAYAVKDNRLDFYAAPGLHALRPDRSTFEVLDRFEDEVLYVRYLNRDAVRIRGRFLCGENPQVVIHDRSVLLGGVRIGGVIFGQHRDAARACIRITPQTSEGVRIGTPPS